VLTLPTGFPKQEENSVFRACYHRTRPLQSRSWIGGGRSRHFLRCGFRAPPNCIADIGFEVRSGELFQQAEVLGSEGCGRWAPFA